MTAALSDITAIAHGAERDDGRLADMALVARMITISALQRTESRGGHCRSDYPRTAEAWEKRSFVTLKEIDILTDKIRTPARQLEGVA